MNKGHYVVALVGLGGIAAAGWAVASRWSPPVGREEHDALSATHGQATVIVYSEGLPFAKRPVVFQDASGEIRSTGETGPDGRATGAVRAGDMVTVAYGGPKFELITILDVQEGDKIVVGEKEGDPKQKIVATVIPQLPGPHPKAKE